MQCAEHLEHARLIDCELEGFAGLQLPAVKRIVHRGERVIQLTIVTDGDRGLGGGEVSGSAET